MNVPCGPASGIHPETPETPETLHVGGRGVIPPNFFQKRLKSDMFFWKLWMDLPLTKPILWKKSAGGSPDDFRQDVIAGPHGIAVQC